MVDAFLVALGVVFVAELGDKSQLLTLTFAARYRAAPVLIGLVLATATLMAVSVSIGQLVSGALPERPVEVVAGLVFLGFAVWTWLGDEDDDEVSDRTGGRSAVVATAVAFALAELGDKTMLATITLATQSSPLGTWAGATLGMVSANALALVVGDRIGEHVAERVVRMVAAGLFALFGVLLLVGVL